MSYKDRFGGTEIKNEKRERLAISWDFDDDENDIKQRYPVILFVPDQSQPDHWHIHLTDTQAKELRDWLTQFLKTKLSKGKKRKGRRT